MNNVSKMIFKVIRIAVSCLVAVVLLAGILVIGTRLITGKSDAGLFGYNMKIVLTDSMNGSESDSFPGNSVIIIKALDKDEYKVGDIVTFTSSGSSAPTTHRIIGINGNIITTKGDANNTPDMDTITSDSIVGKVVLSVPKLGGFFRWLRTVPGIICLIAVVLLIMFVPEIFKKKENKADEQENFSEANAPSQREKELQAELDRLKAQSKADKNE